MSIGRWSACMFKLEHMHESVRVLIKILFWGFLFSLFFWVSVFIGFPRISVQEVLGMAVKRVLLKRHLFQSAERFLYRS